jgi:hypothetical protein
LFLTFWVTLAAIAQQKPDVIIKRNGEKIQGYVRQISPKEIFYGQDETPANVVTTIPISDVAAILYWDGKLQSFAETTQTPAASKLEASTPISEGGFGSTYPLPIEPEFSPSELYSKGLTDGGKYYTYYKGAGTGTFLLALVGSPLLGLIPAIGCSSTPPQTINLTIPATSYSEEPAYVRGFRESALKKKRNKVWANYGIGSALSLFGILFIAAKRQN